MLNQRVPQERSYKVRFVALAGTRIAYNLLPASRGEGIIRHVTFSARAIRAEIRSTDGWDYGVDFSLPVDGYVEEAEQLFNDPSALDGFNRFDIGSKRAVSYSDYPTVLLLRTLSTYLRKRFDIGIQTREDITKGLIQALGDATPIHIIRRDIRGFYESVPTADIYENLVYTTALPAKARRLVERFFAVHCPANTGLPRGLGISATLAELAMQPFDAEIRRIEGVYRYHRFVDDMIVICTNPNGVADAIENLLPQPMRLHRTKRADIAINEVEFPDKEKPPSFEYLGYNFSVQAKPKKGCARSVVVGIAERKINRIKSRLLLAARAYMHDQDSSMLLMRVRYLSGNYKFAKKRPLVSTGTAIVRSGIFYNYKYCGEYCGSVFKAATMPELKRLDWFLHNTILGNRHAMGRHLVANVPPGHLGHLRRLSFVQGHLRAFNVPLTSEQVDRIKSIWKNV